MLAVATSTCVAEPITRNSGQAELDGLKKYYTVPNFRLGGEYEVGAEATYEFGGKGGVTLESLVNSPLKLGYIAVGTPKRDKDGKITNAVLISSYWSGDSTWCYFFWYDGQKGNSFSEGPVVGPGKMIDTNKFYVVFADALALWGTSKPSDGLGMKFPKYSCYDMVQANYRLLKDHLGVSKVKLATGGVHGSNAILRTGHPASGFRGSDHASWGMYRYRARNAVEIATDERGNEERSRMDAHKGRLLLPLKGQAPQ